MKVNGSLVFDASSASEIQNLRLQKVGANPTIVAADVGRLIYNTADGIIYVGVDDGGLTWVPLATGGDASALLAEVDRIETSLGLNGDGSFNAAAFTGNLAGQTTYVELITTLQGLVAAAQAAADAEATRALAAEAALGTRITDETTAREAADTTLTTNLAAEVTRATGEETRIEGLVGAEVTRATAAEVALGGRVDTETAARIAADEALQAAIDAEEAARIAGDETNSDALAAEVTRATAAEAALDGRITTEVSDRTAAVNTVATNLAAEVTRATAAETALGGRVDQEITDRTAEAAAIRGELASALVGLTWEAPVDLIATDAAANAAGKPDGFRIVDTTLNQIFTVTGGAVGTGEPLEDGAAFFNRTNDVGYTYNGTDVVPFSGASSFVAGAGLSLTGNTVNVGNSDGSITITADEIAVSAAVRTEITDNAAAIAAEEARATTAEEGLDDRVDDEVQARIDAIAGEVAARDAAIAVETARATAAEAALGVRVDATEAAIDTAEAAAAALVETERTRALAAEAALQAEIDAEEAARATAITTVTGLVTDEQARAEAAEAAIAADLTTLTGRVGKMYFLYDNGSGAEATAATSHVVDHNLGQSYCNVTVISGNEVVIPQSIVFNTPNRLTVTFNTAVATRVVVMGLAAVA